MKLKIFFLFILLINSITSYEQIPNWVWAKKTTGNGHVHSNDIITDNVGNVYTIGYSSASIISFGGITLINTSGSYLVKYDAFGNVLWAISIPQINSILTPLTTDNFGNIYIVGNFNTPTINLGNITLINSGASDIFIAKYNASGSVLWAKSVGGSDYDIVRAIATDNLGNIYITGGFASSSITIGSTTLANTNFMSEDIFIAKYDAMGNALWAKSTGGYLDDIGTSITTDNSNNVFVSGEFNSPTITFGSTTLINASPNPLPSDRDIFIAKYDALGNSIWAKSISATFGSYITTDNSGNLYITGNFDEPTISIGNITLTKIGIMGTDFYIAKYNAMGNVLWAKSVGGSSWDYCSGIVSSNNGNIYITGTYMSSSISFSGSTTVNNSGSYDVYLAGYDALGNVLWAKSEGGNLDDNSSAISTDNLGNIYITGSFDSPTLTFGNTTLINSGFEDAFVAKLSTCTLPQPTITASGSTTFCVGGSVTLMSSAANSYLWSNAATTQSITIQTPGLYWVQITDANACTARDSIVINTLPIPVVNLGNDTVICTNQILPFTINAGTNGVAYLWNTGATSQSITVSASGTYSVIVTGANGCINTDAITVTFALPPQVNLGSDISTCSSAPIILDAGNIGSTYLWSTGVTSQSISVSSSGTYWAKVTSANTCINTDTINVLFNLPPQVNLGNDTSVCTNIVNPSFTLNAGNAGSTYLWNTGLTTQSISVSSSGTYSVIVTGTNTCENTDTITVMFKPALYVNLGNDSIMCSGDLIILSAGVGYESYLWSDGSTLANLNVSTPGIYSIIVTKEGCIARDEVKIRECNSEIWFPNAFSPNGDGLNDFFNPVYNNIDKKTLTIFNRWGNKIYEGSGKSAVWDGKYLGELCPEGVYYYVLDYEEKGDGKRINKQLYGSITLLR